MRRDDNLNGSITYPKTNNSVQMGIYTEENIISKSKSVDLLKVHFTINRIITTKYFRIGIKNQYHKCSGKKWLLRKWFPISWYYKSRCCCPLLFNRTLEIRII